MVGKAEMTEKLIEAHKFTDGMADETKSKKRQAMPKWLLQGFIYGMFLSLVAYLSGAIAVNAVPAAFPATLPTIAAALGFLAAIGIAYTKDITE